jgi:hypothetical protein
MYQEQTDERNITVLENFHLNNELSFIDLLKRDFW